MPFGQTASGIVYAQPFPGPGPNTVLPTVFPATSSAFVPSGTSLPGHPGNVALSGHRDTFFRPLRNIRESDRIFVTTLEGAFRYRVVSTRVVGPDRLASPNDAAVLNVSQDEIPALVTCYPFYFAGPASDRFIVRAERLPQHNQGREACIYENSSAL